MEAALRIFSFKKTRIGGRGGFHEKDSDFAALCKSVGFGRLRTDKHGAGERTRVRQRYSRGHHLVPARRPVRWQFI
jgi:hypothetical protein